MPTPQAPRGDGPYHFVPLGPPDAFQSARAKHRDRVRHLSTEDAVALLAADYEARCARIGLGELARHRVQWLRKTVLLDEALVLLAWYLAEGDVGLAPGGEGDRRWSAE